MGFLKSFTILILVTTAVACAKKVTSIQANNPQNKAAATNGLAGTWRWLRTDGGLAFHIHNTPLSTGTNIDLKLAGDSTYAIFTNGVITTQGTYKLEKQSCMHDRKEKDVLFFSAGEPLMIEKLNGDTLTLSDERYDGLGSQYIRASATAK